MKTTRLFTTAHPIACAVFSGILFLAASDVQAKAELNGKTITTPRHVIELADTGLPASLRIQADDSEIPLPERGGDVSEGTLSLIGRGEQLSDAVLAVRMGETRVVAVPEGDMKAKQKGADVNVKSLLKAGEVTFELDVTYTSAGAMFATVQIAADGVEVQSVALQTTLASTPDFVLPTQPGDTALNGVSRAEFAPLRVVQGTMWENAGEFAENRTIVSPGLLKHLFVGNGDMGFTWLTDGQGFDVSDEAAFASLARDDQGNVTWTVNLVNHPVTLKGKSKAEFGLLTHPARPSSSVSRGDLWFKKPLETKNAATPETSLKAAMKTNSIKGDVVRADAATVFESAAEMNLLAGSAGGEAESVDKDIVDTYAPPLFRYYAGTHTSLPALLRSNSRDLTHAGGTPKPDRMVLSRALLNGIAADITQIAHVNDAAKVLKMMEDFGFFADDGMTEFIPYWRAESYLRYGEEFTGDRFAVTKENPVGEVYEVIYRRPVEGEAGRYEALVFIVNETDENQTEQFYLFDAKRLLGASNSLRIWPVWTQEYWQEGLIPPNSDWRKNNVDAYVRNNPAMIDMEGEGYVRQAAVDGNLEIYGPVFIHAHDFRVFHLSGKTSNYDLDR